jgi:hypothetical protein
LVKIEGTIDEIKRLFIKGLTTELKKEAEEQGTKVVKRIKKRAKSEWQKFLKNFKFRKQKRNESNSAYFGARTKAASKAYRRKMKVKRK